MIVAEDEDLVVWPYVIEGRDEMMRVFGEFVERSQFDLDVGSDEVLNVLSYKLVDFDFVPRGRFGVVDGEAVDDPK